MSTTLSKDLVLKNPSFFLFLLLLFFFFFARYRSWFERENKSKSKVDTQRNTCFSSKSILRYITAKDIKTQNQIDMGVKGRYRYILTAEGALNLFV